MIRYQEKTAGTEQPVAGASPDEFIAPAPRVSVQAFCETAETASIVQDASEDRRLAKAHLRLQMGGIAAALEAYRTSPTPNVVSATRSATLRIVRTRALPRRLTLRCNFGITYPCIG